MREPPRLEEELDARRGGSQDGGWTRVSAAMDWAPCSGVAATKPRTFQGLRRRARAERVPRCRSDATAGEQRKGKQQSRATLPVRCMLGSYAGDSTNWMVRDDSHVAATMAKARTMIDAVEPDEGEDK